MHTLQLLQYDIHLVEGDVIFDSLSAPETKSVVGPTTEPLRVAILLG